MEEVKFDFDVLRLAKVRQDELATFMDVSRVSVNGWVAGKSVHKARHKRLTTYLRALRLAVEKGELPLQHGMPQYERYAAIKAIFLAYLTAQNQA